MFYFDFRFCHNSIAVTSEFNLKNYLSVIPYMVLIIKFYARVPDGNLVLQLILTLLPNLLCKLALTFIKFSTFIRREFNVFLIYRFYNGRLDVFIKL